MVFLDTDTDRYVNGRLANGVYALRFGRCTPDLDARIADFLRYETAMGRTTLVYREYDFDVAGRIAVALARTPPSSVPRPTDPRVVVHSTTHDRLASILHDGKILPAVAARERLPSVRPIGFLAFGEPDEYDRYVYFSAFGSASGELVVASHQRGRVHTDPDARYEPGGRIYLDFRAMLSDGLIHRDGVHVGKAAGAVALARYAVTTITAGECGGEREPWTPGLFARAADELFALRHPGWAARDCRDDASRGIPSP